MFVVVVVLLLVSYCVLLCFVLKSFFLHIFPLATTPHHSTQLNPRCWTHVLAITESLCTYCLFFLSGRKWLTYVRSIYQIWQRVTVHPNWLSILGMALSTCGSMKMNLTLSLQTHQILLVCIIIIIIVIVVVLIPQFGSRKRACIWPNQYCSVLLQVLHFLLGFSQSKDIVIFTVPSWGIPLLKFFWLPAILYTRQL